MSNNFYTPNTDDPPQPQMGSPPYFAPELESYVDSLIRRYPCARSAAVMILHAIQERVGFITPAAMEWTASKLQLDPVQILELVTFYPMFTQKPLGKLHIKFCRSLPCMLKGSHDLYRAICRMLSLNPDDPGPQTTPDGKITVEQVECLAACDQAPVAIVNKKLVPKCTPGEIEHIIRDETAGAP